MRFFISSRFHPTICRNQINTYTTMKNNFQKSRNIRIFISSTFQDMQSERDMLVTKVFPRLRQIAYERNVTLTEVDLRWGITEEEAKSSKVVEICLDEIRNSHPFFIGLLGMKDTVGVHRKKHSLNTRPCLIQIRMACR